MTGSLLSRWPLPALLAWAACWLAFQSSCTVGASAVAAGIGAGVLGVSFALAASTPWRRIFIGGGFPLSLAASGAAGTLPSWAWLLALAALAFLYPPNAWGDAPLFPTPCRALSGLARHLDVPERARILDAGCGLGSALIGLRREFPRAIVTGIEWSRPLRLLCALRCRFAEVCRKDMWVVDWTSFDVVYLFQRPESMPRAAAKALHELAPGAWLASLEFEVVAWRPTRIFTCSDGRPLWLYRAPFQRV